MKTKKTVKTKAGRVRIQHSVAVRAEEDRSVRFRGDCKQPGLPRHPGRGRSFHTEVETQDE